MLQEFHIPVHLQELEESGGREGFVVEDVFDIPSMPVVEISSIFDTTEAALEEKPYTIVNGEHFGAMYSFVKYFEELEDRLKKQLVALLVSLMKKHLLSCAKVIIAGGLDEGSAIALGVHKTALKMYAFLCYGVIVAGEHQNVDGRGAKRSTAKDTVFKWEDARKDIVQSMLTVYEKIELGRLFQSAYPDEDFVNVFITTSFTLLEGNLSRLAEFRKSVIGMAVMAIPYLPNLSGVANSVLTQVMKFEHMGPVMADLVEYAVVDHDVPGLVTQLFREIGRIEPETFSQDQGGARLLSLFLSSVSEKVPKVTVQNLSLLLRHLNGESYSIRNGIVHMLGQAVARVLAHDASLVRTRDQFLGILLERFMDINAYSRSKVCQVWTMLCKSRVIPVSLVPDVTKKCVDRLHDKSAFVRRSAAEYLSAVLEHNPYGPVLVEERLQKNLDEVREKISAIRQASLDKSTVSETETSMIIEAEGPSTPQQASQLSDVIASPDDSVSDGALEKLVKVEEYLSAAISFASLIRGAVEPLSNLLGSKSTFDAQEAIYFVSRAYEFSVDGAINGVRKMLMLVWSREPNLVTAATDAFFSLFLKHGDSKRSCHELMSLLQGASIAEYESLAEMMTQLCKKDMLPKAVIGALFGVLESEGKKLESSSESVILCRDAIVILGIIGIEWPDIIRAKLGILSSIGLVPRRNCEELTRCTCGALKNIGRRLTDDETKKPVLLEPNHAVCQGLLRIVSAENADDSKWFPVVEEAITAIFALCSKPEELMSFVIRKLTKNSLDIEDLKSLPASKLAHLFLVVGHTAMKHYTILEKQFKEKKNELVVNAKKEEGDTSEGDDERDDEIAESMERQLDVFAAYEHDLDEENEKKLELVLGRRNIISTFGALLIHVAAHSSDSPMSETLLSSTVVALSKFMLLNYSFCRDNLSLLFSLLENSESAIVRTNIVVALGDLVVRYANLLEPWTGFLYNRLRDPDVTVRKHTLMVLSHLVLNDMVKARGHMGEISVALEDEDPRIRDSCRVFFSELTRKNKNAVYNILPDVISYLSSESSLPSETYENVMKYLLSFIDKERQTESIIDKLCHRFRGATLTEGEKAIRSWRYLAFVLSQLNCSEKSVKKLIERMKYYEEALVDEEVLGSFLAVAQKARKFSKQELRTIIEEWESTITKKHEELLEEHVSAERAISAIQEGDVPSQDAVPQDEDAVKLTEGLQKMQVDDRKKPKVRKSSRRRRRVLDESDEDM